MTRFGIGWRPELAAGILANLERIDVVEVLADEYFDASAKEKRALRFVRSLVPVVLHATSLGLASPEAVESRRIEAVARVLDWLEPDFWSEHLAFVRAGRTEIGHLAAPPRNEATLEGLALNVHRVTAITGCRPLLENAASLVDPPLSTFSEHDWLRVVPKWTGCELLLDLHNLHANATNFGFDAGEAVRGLAHVGAVHLAGGRPIEGGRILDDHRHSVPDPVYALLAEVEASDPAVILERDGDYPPIECLLSEIDVARSVWTGKGSDWPALEPVVPVRRSSPANSLHAYLARLYTDPRALTAFGANPLEEALRAGLSAEDARGVAAVSMEALHLAARSFARKRASRDSVTPPLQ